MEAITCARPAKKPFFHEGTPPAKALEEFGMSFERTGSKTEFTIYELYSKLLKGGYIGDYI